MTDFDLFLILLACMRILCSWKLQSRIRSRLAVKFDSDPLFLGDLRQGLADRFLLEMPRVGDRLLKLFADCQQAVLRIHAFHMRFQGDRRQCHHTIAIGNRQGALDGPI